VLNLKKKRFHPCGSKQTRRDVAPGWRYSWVLSGMATRASGRRLRLYSFTMPPSPATFTILLLAPGVPTPYLYAALPPLRYLLFSLFGRRWDMTRAAGMRGLYTVSELAYVPVMGAGLRLAET